MVEVADGSHLSILCSCAVSHLSHPTFTSLFSRQYSFECPLTVSSSMTTRPGFDRAIWRCRRIAAGMDKVAKQGWSHKGADRRQSRRRVWYLVSARGAQPRRKGLVD